MNSLIRTLLFLTAFSPVLFSIAVVRFQEFGWGREILQYLIMGLLGSTISFLIVKALSSRGEVIPFKAKKIESNDFMILVFLFSYVSPFVAKAAGVNFDTVVLFVLLLGAVLWFIQSIPAHPVLRLFSIRFYKVEADSGMVYTLISREELRSPSQLQRVQIISSTMLLKAK
jgi:hypothetical protein